MVFVWDGINIGCCLVRLVSAGESLVVTSVIKFFGLVYTDIVILIDGVHEISIM